MKIAMMSYTMARGEWGRSHNIEELCRFTQELNIKGIDWATTYGHNAQEIRRISDDYGLKTVCYTFFADINFSSRKDRQPGQDQIKQGIETALVLGTDKIMLPIRGKEGLSREESRRNVIAGLGEAVVCGKAYGVRVSVEHFPDPRGPFVTSGDINQALEEIPDLRVTYDSGNVVTGGESPITGFVNSKSSIIHVHFKDWQISSAQNGREGLDGRFYAAALVGEGIVDHKGVLEVMKESQYSGYIDLEYEGNKYSPREAMLKGSTYLNSLISELR